VIVVIEQTEKVRENAVMSASGSARSARRRDSWTEPHRLRLWQLIGYSKMTRVWFHAGLNGFEERHNNPPLYISTIVNAHCIWYSYKQHLARNRKQVHQIEARRMIFRSKSLITR
jgi:hypothetical protein